MLTQADINLLVTMGSLGIFGIGFISFMWWQEKRLENLEKKSKK